MRKPTQSPPAITETEKRRRFFYAMLEAKLYDATIEWVCPYYRLLHDTLVALVGLHIAKRPKGSAQNPYYVLDIGCGTGAESLSLLEKFPFIEVVGVDLAGPMLEQLQEKLEKRKVASGRFTLVEADFLTDSCLSGRLQAHLPKEVRKRGFDAIISAFTLHHFTVHQKRIAYRRAHECLARGGVMLNGDLFNYERESPQMSTAALEFEVNWIRDHFRDAPENDVPMSVARRKDLSAKWVAHYYDDNSYNSVTTQMNMLRAVGFREVANPFRYWQVGLLWGLK
jgi:ubiquinone/menaquinone biosynthesis C-methylase UbiE